MASLDEDEAAGISILQSIDDSGSPIMRLVGELDLSNVNGVRDVLESVFDVKRLERLVIEVSGLTFMDSSGIALLVEAAQHVGILELQNPSKLIRRVLEATGVSEILRLSP